MSKKNNVKEEEKENFQIPFRYNKTFQNHDIPTLLKNCMESHNVKTNNRCLLFALIDSVIHFPELKAKHKKLQEENEKLEKMYSSLMTSIYIHKRSLLTVFDTLSANSLSININDGYSFEESKKQLPKLKKAIIAWYKESYYHSDIRECNKMSEYMSSFLNYTETTYLSPMEIELFYDTMTPILEKEDKKRRLL
jgi:hypothetical protein